ncbi:MAG: hypothetical protein QOH62_2559 [Solirubrobacteraceae bacterium]|nr:hypothetical protein [Solirubrobacteraceae bacterium]
MNEPAITRRQALAGLGGGALALWLSACGGGARPSASGSTLHSTWRDPAGSGILRVADGIPLIDRTELAPRAAPTAVLGTFAHVTDAHVLDAESPARVPFLARLGSPFSSTFRPHETLTAHVLAGAVRAIDELAPDAVIQGGDLIDNVQANELARALAVLHGGRVEPGSGAPGYQGVQRAGNPDSFYYRPDLDAPRHPGMLERATEPFRARGITVARTYPVLGDHDLLVQGIVAPSALTRVVAVGDHAVWELPAQLRTSVRAATSAASPDGIADPGPLNSLIEQLAAEAGVRVTADAARRELAVAEVIARLRGVSGLAASGALLDYGVDVGEHLRLVVLDLVRRDGGSGGIVHPGQSQWLAEQLATAGERWVLVFCHQPLTSTTGGGAVLRVLDRHRRVLAVIWGHTHRNRIVPRHTAGGGYWLISTASLIDHPQQARALQVVATPGGGVALRTWMLDHVADGPLGDISRQLAYLDAQGGRPQGFAGGRLDQNVTLYRA